MPNRHIAYVMVATLEEMGEVWNCDPRTLYRHLEKLDVSPVDYVTGPDGMSRPRFNCDLVIRRVFEANLVPLERILPMPGPG